MTEKRLHAPLIISKSISRGRETKGTYSSLSRGVALEKWTKQKPKNWILQRMGTTELKSVNNVPK